MAAPTIIKIRRDTWVGWRDANTVLNDGELGLDTTYNKVKVGNGVTAWNDLKYGLDFSDIKSTLVPDSDASFDVGTSSKRFRDLYLSNKVIHLGDGVIELDSNNNITTQIDGNDNRAYVVDVINSIIDSAYVAPFVAGVTGFDSGYVQARQDYAYSSLTGAPAALSDLVNDNGFLNTDGVTSLVDSAYVQARQVDFYRDSGFVVDIVDSAYVQARQVDFYRDSGFVTGIVDAAYIQANQTPVKDSAFVTSIVDTAYVQANQVMPEDIVNATYINSLVEFESSFVSSIVDVAYVQARVPFSYVSNIAAQTIDQDFLEPIIDSAYVQARQVDATTIIDSAYVQARQTTGGTGLDSAGLEDYLNGKIGTHLIPDANSQYDLGEPENKFRDLYLSSATMYIGDTKVSMDSSGNFVHTNPFVGGEGFGGIDIVTFNKNGNGEFKIRFNKNSPNPTWLPKTKNISKGDKLINIVPYSSAPIPTELTITSNYTHSQEYYQGEYTWDDYTFLTDYTGGPGDSGWIHTFEHQAAPITRASISDDISTVIDSGYVVNKVTPAVEASIVQNAPEAIDQTILAGLIPTDWEAPVPTTLVEAINRIVTKLKQLNGNNPI